MSLKTLTAEVIAAARAEQNRTIFFLEVSTPDGPVRLNSRRFDRDWNGYSWLGRGRFAGSSISGIVESSDMGAQGFTVEIVLGLAAPLAFGVAMRGQPATIWKGFLDDDGDVIPDPIIADAGYVDRMSVTLGQKGKVQVVVLSRFARWSRINPARMTDADQKASFPADRAYEFINANQRTQKKWGR